MSSTAAATTDAGCSAFSHPHYHPSFSGLLNDIPTDVRSTVEPPDFFLKFPHLAPPTVRIPIATTTPTTNTTTVSPDASLVPLFAGDSNQFITADRRQVAGHEEGRKVVRIVCISDTHNGHRLLNIPPADILIHSGDFSDIGLPADIMDFCDWLDSLTQVKHKIVVAGNHDLSLDASWYHDKGNWKRFRHPQAFDTNALIQRLRQSCIYLDHEYTVVEGLTVFGSPYQPYFYDWAFNLGRENFECHDKWASIASTLNAEAKHHHADNDDVDGRVRRKSENHRMVDILITHGPPLGILDLCEGDRRQGCLDLLDLTLLLKPKLHVFGHIHEEFGLVQHTSTGTVYCNASQMNVRMRMLDALSAEEGTGQRGPVVLDLQRASV